MMPMTGPSAAPNSSPASRAPIKIDQMELAPIPLGVIQQKAVQHILRIRMLFKTLQSANSQIRIGVSLGCDGTNSRSDVGNSGAHGQVTGRYGNAETTVVGISRQD
jgi:hypothetical protein